MFNQKIASELAVGVIIIAALAVGGYAYWQNKGSNQEAVINDQQVQETAVNDKQAQQAAQPVDETANWQTYTNRRVGYSFEYPAGNLRLNLNETIKYPQKNSGAAENKDLVQFGMNDLTYSIEVTVGINKETIESWIKDSNVYHGNPNLANYNKEMIGNQIAYSDKDGAVVRILYNNNIYEIIAYDGIAPTSNTDDLIYRHILSTFKFSSADETANFNNKETKEFTYSDPKNEFQYTKIEFNVIEALSQDIYPGDERDFSAFAKADTGITYKFSYKNNPDWGFWTVSVVSNKPHYKNEAELGNAFPVSGVGYNYFPKQVSDQYLLFESGCGGAVDVDEIDMCSDLKNDISESIKLK